MKNIPDGFDLFWIEYPKKTGKGAAIKAWEKINPNAETISKILKALDLIKRTEQWQNIKYIPMPTTWLNQMRWEDEVEEPKRPPLYTPSYKPPVYEHAYSNVTWDATCEKQLKGLIYLGSKSGAWKAAPQYMKDAAIQFYKTGEINKSPIHAEIESVKNILGAKIV